MILINIGVDNVNTVLQVYNQVLLQKASSESGPFLDIVGLGPVNLIPNVFSYTVSDSLGLDTDWYRTKYYSNITSASSGWSSPVLGEYGEIYYNPLYPSEISLSSAEKEVIRRIRLLIGDPIKLIREFGSDAESSIMSDGKTYVMDEKGWPCFVNMNGTQYTDSSNPSVNGYKYLRFADYIDIPITIISGTRLIEKGVDIWYYASRWADREIMTAYNSCPVPIGLTTTTANAECYMVATALDLLSSETWEAISETGVIISDDRSRFDVSPGMRLRGEMLDKLNKRLDALTRSLLLTGVQGVLLD